MQVTQIILRIILFLLVVEVTLLAQEKIRYSIAYVGMSMDYREYNNKDVLLDSESSDYCDLSGIEFGYVFNLQNEDRSESNSISIDAMILDGSTHYVGALMLDSTCNYYGCYKDKTLDTIYDINFDVTHNYRFSEASQVEFSLGVGYRYWLRELSSSQSEGYEWFSLRPAIGFLYSFKDLRINPRVEYQYGIRPRLSATGIDKDFKLGAANIFELSLPLEYSFSRELSLYATYMYQYQKIEKSNVVNDNILGAILEPDSIANNRYIKFGFVFKY